MTLQEILDALTQTLNANGITDITDIALGSSIKDCKPKCITIDVATSNGTVFVLAKDSCKKCDKKCNFYNNHKEIIKFI